MRLVLFAVLGAALCSVARGAPAYIESAAVGFYEETRSAVFVAHLAAVPDFTLIAPNPQFPAHLRPVNNMGWLICSGDCPSTGMWHLESDAQTSVDGTFALTNGNELVYGRHPHSLSADNVFKIVIPLDELPFQLNNAGEYRGIYSHFDLYIQDFDGTHATSNASLDHVIRRTNVPEPSGLGLASLGLVGLALHRIRRWRGRRVQRYHSVCSSGVR
jgi:hypothetical protein